jgi:hypothetical protein
MLKMLNLKRNIKSITLNKKKFSTSSIQVYDSVVKLSTDKYSNEIKVPALDKVYSIYFNKNENLNDLQERIVGIDDKIVKVEILNLDGKSVDNLNNTLIKDFLSSPFKLKLNN